MLKYFQHSFVTAFWAAQIFSFFVKYTTECTEAKDAPKLVLKYSSRNC